MQLHASDMDAAIAEFSVAVGDLFSGHRREVDLLKSRIAELHRKHKNASALERQLTHLVTQQIALENLS